jgi:hypothetical protein
MRRIYRAAATIAAAALLTAASATATQSSDPPPRLRVRVVPRYAPEPGNMRVIALIERDEHNRRLVVEIDSRNFYRASERSLNGDRSARRHAVTFTHLPAGEYEVRVRLIGTDINTTEVLAFYVTSAGSR